MKLVKKISNVIMKKFNRILYTMKISKTKPYNGKININFRHKKIPKEGSQYICVSVILIDSVYRKDKNYYCQVFLEKSK